jgi:pilus assembly protein CpaC
MRRWIHIIAAACVLGLAAPAAGEPGRAPELPSLDIKIGHSRVVRLKQTVKRVSVGKPEIADVLVINTHQVYVNAKGVGSTNITVWGKEDRLVGIFEVRAYRDLSLLKKRLHEVLPGEPIEVRELQGAVVLSGRVSSTEAKSQAELLAKAMAPRDDLAKQIHKQQQLDRWVVNVLEVGAVKQVSLKVRFAEVRRDALKSLKINLGFRDLAGSFFNTFLGGLTFPLPPTNNQDPWSSNYNNQVTPWSDRPFDVGHSSKTNIAGGLVWDNTNRLMTYIEALKDNGLARVLAEPNLVAASGGEAEFLAGGEFPIPVPQKDNITIYFKKFGVRLKFKPEVLSGGRIRMEVEPEVSDLDWSAAVQIASYAVPGPGVRHGRHVPRRPGPDRVQGALAGRHPHPGGPVPEHRVPEQQDRAGDTGHPPHREAGRGRAHAGPRRAAEHPQRVRPAHGRDGDREDRARRRQGPGRGAGLAQGAGREIRP